MRKPPKIAPEHARGGALKDRGAPESARDPKGPKIEKIQDRPPGLKFSISIENFNLDTQQTPIFCGEF